MYGTVARLRFKQENWDALVSEITSQPMDVDGFEDAGILKADEPGTAFLAVKFRDKASYVKNADSPEQNERFMKFRALLDADPEWSDGEWVAKP